MPQWGLTENQRRARPWSIPPDWLEPAKVNTDPIHGDIYLNRLEQAIVDSPPFQRLRRIRQLGMVHLVYPGATHTRFSHALGALRVVQDLLDIVLNQRNGRHADMDLFLQWEEQFDGPAKRRRGQKEAVKEFELKIAEAVVLARLGSLLHDLCHVPFGHTIEDDLKLLTPHDENPERLNAFWADLGDNGKESDYQSVQEILNKRSLRKALRIILLSKVQKRPPDVRLREMGKYPFVADLVTNTICADLLDYLPRDHNFTGLPVELGQRFMSAFYVLPAEVGNGKLHFQERMALRISESGRERHDIKSELLKHLRYRYELQERAIVHHAKLAADSMLGKALELWYDELKDHAAQEVGGAGVDHAIRRGAEATEVWSALEHDIGATGASAAEQGVKGQVEAQIRKLGDDSLLEYLAGNLESPEAFPPVGAKVRSLAKDLLDRRLFKRAAEAKRTGTKGRVYELFGSRSEQRKLERAAAHFAGVPEEHVVIWLPDPKMRLKVAEVLVDFGHGVAPFDQHSEHAQEIYKAHRELWTATVFVHREVQENQLEPVVLARLAELMGVEWDRHHPRSATQPQDWPICLAASRELDEDLLDDELEELLEMEAAKKVVHRASEDLTFAEMRAELRPHAQKIKANSLTKSSES